MKKLILLIVALGSVASISTAFALPILLPSPYACVFKRSLHKGQCTSCVATGQTCPDGLTDCANFMRLKCDDGTELSSVTATLTKQSGSATIAASDGGVNAQIDVTVDPTITNNRYDSTLTVDDHQSFTYSGTCMAALKN